MCKVGAWCPCDRCDPLRGATRRRPGGFPALGVLFTALFARNNTLKESDRSSAGDISGISVMREGAACRLRGAVLAGYGEGVT